MGHSNFCEGYRLEVIFRFYLTFATVFVFLFFCLFSLCGFVCCCYCSRVGVVFVVVVLFVFGFVYLIVGFFLYCCRWLLILFVCLFFLSFFLVFYRGGGHS